MTLRTRITARLRAFATDETGATLVEFTLVLALYFLLFFGLLDFGRLAFNYVTAEKAMHTAARIAVVRPPACAGVPATNAPGPVAPSSDPPRFGTSCNAASNVCANVATIACNGAAANATASEIWAAVQGGLPNDATIANLRFSYTFDSDLGFLGGPYVPVVTVELQGLNFDFVHPLSGLAALAGGGSSTLGGSITFPTMSVSLPAEDLALGTAG